MEKEVSKFNYGKLYYALLLTEMFTKMIKAENKKVATTKWILLKIRKGIFY